jgi:hypothetical protein
MTEGKITNQRVYKGLVENITNSSMTVSFKPFNSWGESIKIDLPTRGKLRSKYDERLVMILENEYSNGIIEYKILKFKNRQKTSKQQSLRSELKIFVPSEFTNYEDLHQREEYISLWKKLLNAER